MRCLGVFVQAPIPGRVKTRLAADVGPSVAAEVYWQVGRRIVAQVTGSGYRTTVWFAPSTEGVFVREWLEGLPRVELRPQHAGRLGDRLIHTFSRCFADGARRALIISSDCPGVDRRLVAEAFNALGDADIVIGPTAVGGCYLVGLREPQPALLRGLPSAGGATLLLPQLGARAVAARLRLRLLRPLRAVRTAQDARLLGLLATRPAGDGINPTIDRT